MQTVIVNEVNVMGRIRLGTRGLGLMMMGLLTGCQASTELERKGIVILYENDVHCGIQGYTKMAGLRDAINNSDTAYAAVVSAGDFLQGNTTGKA